MKLNREKLLNPGRWYKEFNKEGKCIITHFDNSYCELLGCSSYEELEKEGIVWPECIHPDDRDRVNKCVEKVLEKHSDIKDYDIEYRMMTKTGYRWFHDYAYCTRADDGTLSSCTGIIIDIQESFDKAAHYESLVDNNARIMALEDNFESMYDVDLETGDYEVLIKGETYNKEIKDKLLDINNYFEDLKENVNAVIFPDDREELLHVLSKDNIINGLAMHDHIDHNYRVMVGDTPIWFRVRVVYKDKEKKHVVIGVFNVQKEVDLDLMLEQKARLDEAEAFNKFFLSTYYSAYYVDLNNYSYQIYKAPDTEYARKYIVHKPYMEALSAFLEISVSKEDKKEIEAIIAPEYIKKTLKEQSEYSHVFRDNVTGKERIMRLQVIRGADSDHAALGFTDITQEFYEHTRRLLGAVPLSLDVLVKANIGLWAFELDEGKEPRMYVDDTMLKLLGLEHQVTPEETYHAWYDHVDEGSYDLVHEAVDKMTVEHAEVQYPWHHPDGRVIIVRCGGVRNYEYTQGIRIEGTHQDVTETLHYDEKEIKRLLDAEKQLEHEHLRAEVLNYMVDNEDDPIEFLKNYAERIRDLLGCDQVIYRDLNETRILVNSDSIQDSWSVPIEYCKQCEHFNPHHPMYKDGYTEMENCQEGVDGIPVYHKCPIKSSLTRIVYCDNKVAGYLAIHYIENYHKFTDLERKTLEEFSRILSISLSRYKARQESAELENTKKSLQMILSLADNYDSIMLLDPVSGEYDWFMGMAGDVDKNTNMSLHSTTFYKDIAKDIAEIIHEDDKEQFKAFYSKENLIKIVEDGQPQETENRWFIQTDNRYRYKYNKVVRMFDENGKAYIIVGVIDTTESKEQAEVFKTRKLLADYFLEPYQSAYYVGLFDNSIQTYKRGEKFAKDYPIDDAFVASLTGFINKEVHPEDREKFIEIIQPEKTKELLKEQTEFTYDFRTIRDDEERYVRFQVIRGSDTNHVAFGFRDITEEVKKQQRQQKQLEEALSMAQSASRAKTTFLNNMSHDIRTPMNAIIGYSGLAASHIDNKDQVRDYLNKIGQSSNHLLSLINDVLDMSRIESGKMNLDENPENISEIIHTLRDIVLSDVHSKQLEFFIDAVDVEDEDIVCDKLRLNQVLLNILSNSIKYTPAGGTITMRVKEVAVKDNGYATYEFTVKDTGMGMDKEFLESIFDPFTRAKSSTVSGIQGTGLGMAITKNIVDMVGGKIEVNSEVGKGTEVIVTADFKLKGEHKELDEIPELKDLRALIVDDDSNTCLSASKMVRDIGMREEWCTSGKEAVIRAKEAYRIGNPFRLYIIDWLMPDMNGIEVTRRIRKEVGDDVPIIILTAYDWSDIEEEAREAGVTAFVSKPMFPSNLYKVLNACLGRDIEEEKERSFVNVFKGKKVLLVEDNELNLEIATEILEEYEFIVDTATDGQIAVEKIKAAQSGDYDLVLMDVQMPIMDGYKATKAIRELDCALKDIPIIAMTANAFEEDRKEALAAGMNDYISKPIDIDKLEETIAKYI